MRALTLMQPWAWAVMHAGKNIENRPWNTTHRGLFWVHAGKQYQEAATDWIRGELGLVVPARGELLFGAILGTVELVGVTRDADQWSRWAMPGCVHWMLRYPDPLSQPIPDVTGHQSWWDYPREVR
jgi:hypothetical protein